jgi:hypothetical protein
LTQLGFPPRALFDFESIARDYAGSVWGCFADWCVEWDPAYFEDFWTQPGYLGADAPESLAAARIRLERAVADPVTAEEGSALGLPLTYMAMLEGPKEAPPVALRIDDLPPGDELRGATLTVTSGAAAGRTLYVAGVVGEDIVLPAESLTHYHGLSGIRAGDEVLIDNSQYLAFQTLHRHQVRPDPRPDEPFCVAGRPIYPQRPEFLGHRVVHRARGSHFTGRFPGKMIVVQMLMDEGAWPDNAVHYHGLVEEAWGPRAGEHLRLWFVDHSLHAWWPVPPQPGAPRPVRTTRIIDYNGVVQQALRDLAAWVERGIAPPGGTEYEYVDGQIVVPPTAKARKGIQPVVALTANGAERADVAAGEAVAFRAEVDVPPGAGTIVAAEWDFDGSGDYPLVETRLDGSAGRLTLTASHAFAKPGTYFPALRVTSHRQGDLTTPHARIRNLGRVRVVVT